MNPDKQTTIHELKAHLVGFCKDIGCSMVSNECPGSANCEIIHKAMPWMKKAKYWLVCALREV